jgi:multidrug transporter EmrE-like cation transporter
MRVLTMPGRTKISSIALVLCCTVLGSAAQILQKMGSQYLSLYGYGSLLSNYWLLGGYVCLAGSTLLLIIALKNGDLSVLYPIIATTYIWVILLSPVFFSTDSVNGLKLCGVACIVIGVTTIGYGATK